MRDTPAELFTIGLIWTYVWRWRERTQRKATCGSPLRTNVYVFSHDSHLSRDTSAHSDNRTQIPQAANERQEINWIQVVRYLHSQETSVDRISSQLIHQGICPRNVQVSMSGSWNRTADVLGAELVSWPEKVVAQESCDPRIRNHTGT